MSTHIETATGAMCAARTNDMNVFEVLVSTRSGSFSWCLIPLFSGLIFFCLLFHISFELVPRWAGELFIFSRRRRVVVGLLCVVCVVRAVRCVVGVSCTWREISIVVLSKLLSSEHRRRWKCNLFFWFEICSVSTQSVKWYKKVFYLD